MPGVVYSQIASPDGGYVPRVVRALDRSRMSAVAIVTVALSLGPFYGAEPLDYSLGDMVLEWIYHFAELVVLAGVLTLTYTLLDEALPSQLRMRLGALCLIMLAVSCLLTVMLYLY